MSPLLSFARYAYAHCVDGSCLAPEPAPAVAAPSEDEAAVREAVARLAERIERLP